MDIEKIRKLAKNASEAGKLVKAVTAYKNALKDKEQMHDVVMSDHFKTLREPLIEQQKKTDEKQDKVIEQLQKNQRALTSGIEDLALLQQLPETPTQSSKLPVDYSPAMMETTKHQSNLDVGFTPDELQTLMAYKLYTPSDVFKAVKDKKLDWDDYDDKIGKLLKEIGREKGGLSKGVKAREKNAEKINQLTNEIKTIQKYQKRISVIPEGLKTIGKGVKYKQPKRNAYKIKDGGYGGLIIDLPKLFNEMKLNVFRGGKLVYQSDADKSLVNLLTKRFNPKTKYSMNAVRIFNDLNTLSNMPKHRSSGKSRMVGSSVTYYNNANELADRMKVLIGSIAAGNNSPVLKNDLSQINEELLRINTIDQGLHEKFYQKYLS